MTSDNKYSKILLELKTHYQQTLSELETQTSQLKSRITSLDTLIEDPLLGSDFLSILQGEADSLASEAQAPKNTKTAKPKAEAQPKKTTQKAASKRKSATPKKPASTPKTKKTVEPKAEATPKKPALKASPLSGKRKSPASKKLASTPKSTKSVEPKAEATLKASASSSKKKPTTLKKDASQAETTKKSQKRTSSSSSSVLTMNKPYDQMKKIDAITQIMHENPGKVMHFDDLITRLFGELSKDDHKAERGRIKVAMYQGAKNKLWKKANVPMCYIYDPSLKAESKATTSKDQKSRKKT